MAVREQRPEEYEQLVQGLRNARPPLPLSDEEIQELARRAQILEMMRGDVLMRQGEPPDYLYFLISGQLRAAETSVDPPRLLNYHAAGAFVGEQGMLHDAPRAATLDVISDAKLAAWGRSDVNWLLSLNDQIRPYFEDLYRHREQRARRRPFPGKQWDEVTVIRTGKHPLMLFEALIGPVLLFLFSLALLIPFLLIGEVPPILPGVIVGLPLTISLIWGIFNFVNWRNDEYIVTSKRVIHIERYIIYGEERDEAPLIRIQDVTIGQSNLWERLLNYYDLMIQTAGAGKIVFRGVRDAEQINEAIFIERDKARERREAADIAGIRKALGQRMNMEIKDVDLPVDTLVPTSGLFGASRQLPPLVDYLWPRTSIVEGDTIIWRKHLIVWFVTTWPAMLTFLVLLSLMIVVLVGIPPFNALPPGTWLLELLLGIAVFLSFMWYVYLYDGWYRDIYIVTHDRIVDVNSSSFRLRGEERREGTFEVIQNITYSIPDFFQQLVNMGDVFIETAAVAGNFTFNKVYDPSAVQQEIFNRMVAYQEERRRQQRIREDTRWAEWFQEYHNLHLEEDHPGRQATPQ